jgi:hypothetical protein
MRPREESSGAAEDGGWTGNFAPLREWKIHPTSKFGSAAIPSAILARLSSYNSGDFPWLY